jgi:Family of unknown function (DUF5362)
MGLMPSGQTPFAKLDARSVVGMFKATGARDPDVLHAQREKLLAQPKQLKLLAVLLIAIGVFFTVTVVLAIAGIPSILFGIWMWRFGTKNIAAVEAGFAEYAATLAS